MITVGLYRGATHDAAAVAVDGRIVAALDWTRGHEPRGSLDEVLALAGITAPADAIALVGADGTPGAAAIDTGIWPTTTDGRPPLTVCRERSAAGQWCGHRGDGAVLVFDDESGRARLFRKTGATLDDGLEAVATAAAMSGVTAVAAALGPRQRRVSDLEAIAASRQASSPVTAGAEPGGHFDSAAANRLIATARAGCPQLADSASTHVAVMEARARLATEALEGLARAVAADVRSVQATPPAFVGLSGVGFASPAFGDRVRRRIPGARLAPVLHEMGSALGAALLGHPHPQPLETVALGWDVDEALVKRTLENCRLDYVYEPDWASLLTRVSSLLGTGALVGWVQGRRDFGGSSFGSRSVLADPSARFVRDNVNEFLLRSDRGRPLPVSVLGEDWQLAYEPATSPDVRPVRPAADPQGRVLLQQQTAAVAPALSQLLALHRRRTGVPGLVNVPLADRFGLVNSPRDAIRESFSSAVDVLVLGRFLVSKDYWLIRAR